MKRLIIVRHGETEWNKQQKIMGWKNISLNDLGRTQARLLANYLGKKFKINRIISSDLVRAKETAKIIQTVAYPHLKIEYSMEIRERNYGGYEGLKTAEVKSNPNYTILFEPVGFVQKPPLNGESLVEFQTRILNFLHKICNSESNNLLIVAHGGTNRMIFGSIKGYSLVESLKLIDPQHNCCINDLSYDDKTNRWEINLENFINHLNAY
ncbi:MAG: histidine phosphatase family protein [Candidatus Hodarchaeales archaeon]